MASWLVLDWDHERFHILCAQSSRRGVQVTRAATWAPPEPLTPGAAERVGKALRDFLKAQKITAAPVIVGLGRDRIFLKELRVPPIAAHEEASLVRFQTGKEMAEAVDHYAIDYTYLANGGGERHIMTVAARRDIVAISQALCQAAGLRLHAVTPKLFGAAAALTHSLQPQPTPLKKNQLNAVLSVGQRWGELCIFRGDRLLQVQALANGPLLAAEVRRSLAVFQAQHAVNVDLAGPDRLYVFADDQAILQSLRSGQPLPVQELDPLKDAAGAAENHAAFAGAVGLAALWGDSERPPVNLSAPKRSQAPTTVTQQRFLVYGAAAALLAILFIGGMSYLLADRRATIKQLTEQQEEQKGQLASYAQERADLEYYKDWEQATVPWLDEMYDLTARFPFENGFRVNQFAASTTGSKKIAKDKFVGSIRLSGINSSKYDNLVYDLQTSMARDTHVRSGIKGLKPGADYSMTIDIAKQDIKKYDTQLKVPSRLKAEPPPPEPPPEATLTAEERTNAEPILAPEEKQSAPPDDDEKGGGK